MRFGGGHRWDGRAVRRHCVTARAIAAGRWRAGARRALGILLAVSALAACGPDGDGQRPATDEGDTTANSEVSGQMPDDGAPTGEDTDERAATDGTGEDHPAVIEAIVDAAERTGQDADDIEVVVFEQVTWPDGAVGCPEPDGVYTQALVEGYRVVLDVGDQQLTYHGADGDAPVLCEDPQPPIDTRS